LKSEPVLLNAFVVGSNESLVPLETAALDSENDVRIYLRARHEDRGVVGVVVRDAMGKVLISGVDTDLTDGSMSRLIATRDGVVSINLGRANSPLRACAVVGANHSIAEDLVAREAAQPLSAVSDPKLSCVDLSVSRRLASPGLKPSRAKAPEDMLE
jgi:hypothetical protein